MIITVAITLILVLVVFLYLQQPKFGRKPSGARQQKIEQQPNYKEGAFQNISFTPQLAEGYSFGKVMRDFFFNKSKRATPADVLPAQKTDLHNLKPDENALVWFGHSSYFMQIDGRKFLVDPVFSGSASPIRWTTRSFPGSDVYTVDDIPELDYLIITHDHYDHLDYETVLKLKSKVKKVITSLGVGEHLELWGYNKNNIIEKNWNEEELLGGGFKINTTPARHFSGRLFKRNTSVWQSFVLTTPSLKLFLGGDSGYDTHFKSIGDQYGPFDLAMLECGQYNEAWRYIHMLPPQVVQAAKDLKTKVLFPVHWGKFSLSLHAWDEPILKVTAKAKEENIPLITPMIGQKVNLDAPGTFEEWYRAPGLS
jgi:L-ascorbate metabolism protein UlaG (beta-lactamase superfamily)